MSTLEGMSTSINQ